MFKELCLHGFTWIQIKCELSYLYRICPRLFAGGRNSTGFKINIKLKELSQNIT